MLHGVSFLLVDNSKLQAAIASNASKDVISKYKQQVAQYASYGFTYEKVTFSQLGNLLTTDCAFNPFKYKTIAEGAVYSTEKHPNAWGGIRGRSNIEGPISWICLDVDKTDIKDYMMHKILSNINHHIARTSDPDNPYKYRILIELSESVDIQPKAWKYFINSISNTLNIPIDSLGASQCFYGYLNREVYSTTDAKPLSPSTHLNVALLKVAEAEERINSINPHEASYKLASRYATFVRGFEAKDGEGYNMLLSCIGEAYRLGASKEYTIDLIHTINNFWDYPLSASRLRDTVLSFIDSIYEGED